LYLNHSSLMKVFLTFFLAISGIGVFGQRSSMINVGDGAELYYVEKGKGEVLIFIPGWTMTTEFFDQQINSLSESYRVVSFDPRSHGRSTKETEGNTYAQHAKDLKVLIDALQLKEVVLIGWSSGCHTVFAYFREFGTANIKSAVLIDETPKWIGDVNSEWVYGTYEDYHSAVRGILETRREDAVGIAKWMAARELTQSELNWMVDQMLQTPTYAAFMLYIDSLFSDYSSDLIDADKKIPMLVLLRDSWIEQGRTWLAANAPNAKVRSIKSHLMFWEEPEEFNRKIKTFLTQ